MKATSYMGARLLCSESCLHPITTAKNTVGSFCIEETRPSLFIGTLEKTEEIAAEWHQLLFPPQLK